MSFNNPLAKAVEKTSLKIDSKIQSRIQSKPQLINEVKTQIYNRLAEELCSEVPNKTKIKKLCSEGQILFTGDLVDLMSTVLFELSEIRKYKLR